VVLLRRRRGNGQLVWRARWKDTDTGRDAYENLTALGLATKRARVAWAKQKSDALAEVARRRRRGGVKGRTIVHDAVTLLLETSETRHRSRTTDHYRRMGGKFSAWAAEHRITYVQDIRPGDIARFADSLAAAPRRVAGLQRRRHEGVEAGRPRSAATVNSEIADFKAVLNFWRRRGLLPHVTRDDLADNLRPVPAEKGTPRFLRSEELRQLLQACMAHDAAAFEMTRRERAEGGTRVHGLTPWHQPIAPFLVLLLLSGCRRGEALSVRRDAVDLNAQGGAGEITLKASETKTRSPRAIWLGVSPALRELLEALKDIRDPGDEYIFGGPSPAPDHFATQSAK
jgi:integrase